MKKQSSVTWAGPFNFNFFLIPLLSYSLSRCRTFPHHDYFTDGQGIGQENLFNVLKAYSLYDTEVGYCQGLPFVVAILLLNVRESTR